MSVFYKMKVQAESEYKKLIIDGSYILVEDLIEEILQKTGLKSNDFYLQITNADSKEVYSDKSVVLKNTSVWYSRIPIPVTKRGPKTLKSSNLTPQIIQTDKLNTSQLLNRNYQYNNVRNGQRSIPPNYVCRRCHRPGHWINDCPLAETKRCIRKSSGIPKSFLQTVNGPEVEGAMITADGSYVMRRSEYSQPAKYERYGQRRNRMKPY